MTVISPFVSGFLAATIFASAAPDALDLERRALAARERIHSGEVRFVALVAWDDDRADAPKENRIECDIAFDEKGRVFFEETMNAPPTFLRLPSGEQIETPVVGGRTTTRVVLTEDRFFHYIPDRLTDGETFGIESGPRSDADPRTRAFIHSVFDPRLLGMVPSSAGAYPQRKYDSFLTNPDRREVAVERDAVGGADAWRISYVRKSGTKVRLWISEELGDSLLRVELEPPVKPGRPPWLVTYTSDVVRHDGDIWFPRKTIYEEKKGEKVTTHEEVEVTEARFNFDVPEERFTVAALKPAPGTTLSDETGPARQIWEGGRLRENPAAVRIPDEALKKPAGQAADRPMVFYAVAVVLTGLALFLLYLHYRGRRSPA